MSDPRSQSTTLNLDAYRKRAFTAPVGQGRQAVAVTHDVYEQGEPGPTVVLIQELPGIGQEMISLAGAFRAQGYRVVLPHLFGPIGRISMLGNTGRVFCMHREFKLFAKNASSPIVDWLKALCVDLRDTEPVSKIGVIGMCLTGNFAISLMADDSVLAGVASQPSMPLFDQDHLHMSEAEISAAKARLDTHGPMLALRFSGDKLCTGAKFRALAQTFNDDAERIRLIELPGDGHSVLTLDLLKGGEPAQGALNEVLSYFNSQLKSA